MGFGWDLLRQLTGRSNTWSGDQTFAGALTLSDTVWEDMRVGLSSAKLPASNYPDWVKLADNGAGSTGIFGYSFADGEYIFLSTQFSHKYKQGTTIYPHIHFYTTTNVDPADNFGIGIEYTWLNLTTDTMATSTLVTRDISTGVNSSGLQQFANIPSTGIVGTGKRISSMFVARLYRYAASVDNYAGDIIITDFDIHFEADTIGSNLIGTK